MKLIIGLGNPGKRYRWTRHNLGFLVVEEFAKRNKIVLKREARFNAITSRGKFFGEDIILALPLTYMNLSGNSIKEILRYLKIDLENLLVVCDDINLPFGNIRIRPKGSSGGHNGLLSIIQSIQTQEFPRMRIGVLNREDIKDLPKYLLSNFNRVEMRKLKGIIKRAMDACESWVRNGIAKTMNEFNV